MDKYVKKVGQSILGGLIWASFLILVLSYGEDYMTGIYSGLFNISFPIKVICFIILMVYLAWESLYYFGKKDKK